MTSGGQSALVGWPADVAIGASYLLRKARLAVAGPAKGKGGSGTAPGQERPAPEMGSIVEIDGIRMRIDPLMSPFNIRKLADGRHTIHERSLLSAHLRPDDRVLELGGGIGMVAIHCARAIGSDRVTSYEGNPRMEPLIRENYRLNDVEPDLHMKVLGEAKGSVTFYLAERFSHSSMIDASGRGEPVAVPVEPYADAHARIRPTVLVIDIQGSEIEFFDFADLSGVRMILVEFHPLLTGLRGILRVRRYLRKIGYAEASRSGHSCVFVRDTPTSRDATASP